MLSDLLNKIDDVKKYIPDEIFPGLVTPMIDLNDIYKILNTVIEAASKDKE